MLVDLPEPEKIGCLTERFACPPRDLELCSLYTSAPWLAESNPYASWPSPAWRMPSAVHLWSPFQYVVSCRDLTYFSRYLGT